MVQILFVGLIQHKEGCREGGNAAYTQGLAPKIRGYFEILYNT